MGSSSTWSRSGATADFRRLWTGQAINVIGNQITRVALPYQVYVLTGSTLALAGLVLVQLVPLLLFTLGAARSPTRWTVAGCSSRRSWAWPGRAWPSWCCPAGGPAVPLLFVVAFVAPVSAFDWPARASAVPRLVPPERLRAAIALGQLSFNGGSVIGPAIAGVLIGSIGVGGAYAVDVATFAVSLVVLLDPADPAARRARAARPRGDPRGPPVRPRPTADPRRRSRSISTRWSSGAHERSIRSSPSTCSGRVRRASGLLTAAPGRGGLRGDPPVGRGVAVRRIGRGILLAVAAWGAAITLFGLSTSFFVLALLFLAIAGAADVVSAVLRSTLLQMETPDELRGRVASVHILVVTSGPRSATSRRPSSRRRSGRSRRRWSAAASCACSGSSWSPASSRSSTPTSCRR